MAVVFPNDDEDKRLLLEYLEQAGGGDTTPPVLVFTEDERARARESCTAILNELDVVARMFFSLTRAAPSEGSVAAQFNPHAPHGLGNFSLAPDMSAIPMPLLDTPLRFFDKQEKTIAKARRRVARAAERLRAINRAHQFLLTTDVEALRQYRSATSAKPPLFRPDEEQVETRVSPPPPPPSSSVDLCCIEPHRLPSPFVKRSYARFAQSAQVLLDWFDRILSLLRREDAIPEAGTFTVPITPASDNDDDDDDSDNDRGDDDSTKKHSSDHNGKKTEEDGVRESPPAPPAADAGSGEASPEAAQPPPPRSKTVRIRRYEVHDVQQGFNACATQCKYYFFSNYLTFDPRLQHRILDPHYFGCLRDTIDGLQDEVERLERISRREAPAAPYWDPAVSPYSMYQQGAFVHPPPAHAPPPPSSSSTAATAAGGDDKTHIVFRPSLNHFRLLRDVMRLYWSLAVTETDTTTVREFGSLFAGFVADAQDATEQIRRLPALDGGAVADDDTQRTLSQFLECRANVLYLRNTVKSNIEGTKKTHAHLDASAAVAGERTPEAVQAEARALQAAAAAAASARASARPSPASWWASAKAALQAVLDVSTCQAELDPSYKAVVDTDGKRKMLVRESPHQAEKELLLTNVERLWKVVELEATKLERAYPGKFFRDSKKRWGARAAKVVSKAEPVSTVFKNTK